MCSWNNYYFIDKKYFVKPFRKYMERLKCQCVTPRQLVSQTLQLLSFISLLYTLHSELSNFIIKVQGVSR